MHRDQTILPWYKRWWAVLVGSLIFPPAGLLLLWIRPWRGWKSLLLRPLATLGISILALIHLLNFYGMHAEPSGAGYAPIFTFRDPKKDQDELEKHRAAQKAMAPPAAPALFQTAATVDKKPDAAGSEKKSKARGEAAEKEKPAAVAAVKAYWPDFRGPQRDGNYDEQPVLATWPSGGLKPLWKQPVGGGYASFVIAGGLAFTIEQRRGNEVVAAYDVQTGREAWTNSWAAFFQESMGGDGPRATPTWHNGTLYALGAAGELRAMEAASGKTIWRTNILQDAGAQNIIWGMSGSPLLVDGKVIVQPGGPNASVVAYDAQTGKPVWKSQSDQPGYASLVVATLAGQRQLVAIAAKRVMGLAVDDGKLLWEFPWTTMYDINAAQPVVTDGSHFVISSGYDHGSAMIEITRSGDALAARAVWSNNEMKSRFSSSVLLHGYMYGFDEGIFACIEAKTGKRVWKGGRYGYGQVLLAGDRLVVLSEQGDLVLLRATPEKLDELARFSAIEGKTWNVPAISGGILLVRNAREMAAFKIAP